MGRLSGKGKEGTWLEGKASKEHTHKDGSRGRDVEAFRNTYSGGEVVHSEKASDWGKDHEKDSGGSGK